MIIITVIFGTFSFFEKLLAEGTTWWKSPQEQVAATAGRRLWALPVAGGRGPFLSSGGELGRPLQGQPFPEHILFRQLSLGKAPWPVMDLKTDGSKQFCHFMQMDFLGRFQHAGPSKNPCCLTFQTGALKALPPPSPSPCLLALPGGTQHTRRRWERGEEGEGRQRLGDEQFGPSVPARFLTTPPPPDVRVPLVHVVAHPFLPCAVLSHLFHAFPVSPRTKTSFPGFQTADLAGWSRLPTSSWKEWTLHLSP